MEQLPRAVSTAPSCCSPGSIGTWLSAIGFGVGVALCGAMGLGLMVLVGSFQPGIFCDFYEKAEKNPTIKRGVQHYG